MNRLLEIVAVALGGLSLFTVAFVGFAGLSGKDLSQVAVIGKLFPAPPEEADADAAKEAAVEPRPDASDAAVIESSLQLLSAWTLPSPYSTGELRVLAEELERESAELAERERALVRREQAVAEDELDVEERRRSLEELRAHVERLQADLAARDVELARRESAAEDDGQAGWAEIARVLTALEENAEAGKKLQEYEPSEAALVLCALEDQARAGEILNAVDPARWKAYVDAYSAAKQRLAARKKK